MERYASVLFLIDNPEFDLKEELGDAFDEESQCVYFGDDVWVNPKLGTDDVEGQIFSIKPISKDFKQELKDRIKSTMMSFEFVDENVQFGMRATCNALIENKGSRISKAFTQEHMGFVYKDLFSTYVRLKESDDPSFFDYYLKKHFGYGISDYAVGTDLFCSWLVKTGVDFGEIYNEYSPVESILYGQYIQDGLARQNYNSVKADTRDFRQTDTLISAESNQKYKEMLYGYFYSNKEF